KKEEEEKKTGVPPFPTLSSPVRRRRPCPWAIFLPREETKCLPPREKDRGDWSPKCERHRTGFYLKLRQLRSLGRKRRTETAP
ncbi:hypothetical protein BHE74_00058800, partial [Ensete ventricosum]